MNISIEIKHARLLLLLLIVTSLISGCFDESKLNTDSVTYTPEKRPLDVIAGSGVEFPMGSVVTLAGRLVGTVENGETILWEQTAGTPVSVDDWTASPLIFTAPDIDGIENFTFVIKGLSSAGDALQRDIIDADGNHATEPMQAEVTVTVFDPEKVVRYEVEDSSVATLSGVVLTAEGQDQYVSGAIGSHTRDFTPGASAIFSLDTTQQDDISEGYYSIYVRFVIPASGYGEKGTEVSVNGVPYDFMVPATGTWDNYRVAVVGFEAGVNTIEIGGGWNYYRVDSIALIPAAPPAGPLAVAPTLVNPEPLPEAQSLMAFLAQNYGVKTLSGQTEFVNYANGALELTEFNKIVAATGGDAPAIVAFDFMDYSSSRVGCGAIPGTLSEDMISAHNDRNIILSSLWHWNAPMHLADNTCSSDVSGEAWWHGFYSSATTFDLAAALADTSSAEYQALIDDIDTVAAELQKFEAAGVPILWRPLHEAEGAWFWWGNAGPEALKALWVLMFERMTNEHDLDNLIWVFTHAGELSEDWYPGDAYVDIVGYDGYDGNNRNNAFSAEYMTLKNRFNGKKLVALTETGTIPSVETMQSGEAWWSFFITWNSDGGELGPDGATDADIAASYEYDGVLNLYDVPSSRPNYSVGIYNDFEISVAPWSAQINWENTSGLNIADTWSSSGIYALSMTKDLSAETALESLVFQSYPTDGIDVSLLSTMTLDVNVVDAGVGTTAKLFVKQGNDWTWADSGAVAVAGGVALTIDLSAYDWLAGFGVQFENMDATSTSAEFYLDNVRIDDSLVYGFEGTDGWDLQVNWASVPGVYIASDWQVDGNYSLAGRTLLAETDTDIILQTYPTGGFLLAGVSTLKLHALGEATTAKLWAKDKEGAWRDGGEVAMTVSGVELSLDISDLNELQGFGVQFTGPTNTSTESKFYIDAVLFE